tara:strand:+ start:68 stop:463 length:396 start_codon:yes stop_codon:yes gene_type:complete
MKKLFVALMLTTFLTGCVETLSMFGPAAMGNGKLVQSSINSALSLSVKQRTGKTPTQHVLSILDQNQVKEPVKEEEKVLRQETSSLTKTKKDLKSKTKDTKCITSLCKIAKKNETNIRYSIKQRSSIKNLN